MSSVDMDNDHQDLGHMGILEYLLKATSRNRSVDAAHCLHRWYHGSLSLSNISYQPLQSTQRTGSAAQDLYTVQ